MGLPLILKAFGVATATGTITQVSGYIILHLTKNPILSLLWIEIFGNILAYIAQSYIFGFKNFMLSMALRWAITVCISLFLCVKAYHYLSSLEKVKQIKKELSGWKLDIFKYSLLTLSVIIVFLVWDYNMRRDYIFQSNPKNTVYDLLLIGITMGLVAIDRYFYNYNLE